jgi:hypothetical protein
MRLFVKQAFQLPDHQSEDSLKKQQQPSLSFTPVGSYGSHRAIAVFLWAHLPAVIFMSASNGG